METTDSTNLRELTTDEQRKYGLSSGIKVTGPVHTGEIRWNNNISPGFIIITVNGQTVNGIFTLKQQLANPQGAWISGVYPDGTHDTYFIG
ncbi:MAG: hypothetical protein WA960_05185 [Tunicatimonas sp.]